MEKPTNLYQDRLNANLAKDEKVFNKLNHLINELSQVEEKYLDFIKETYLFIIFNFKFFEKKEIKNSMYLLKKLKKLEKSRKLNKKLVGQMSLGGGVDDKVSEPISDLDYFSTFFRYFRSELKKIIIRKISTKKRGHLSRLLNNFFLLMKDLIVKRKVLADYCNELQQDRLIEEVKIHDYSGSMLGLNACREKVGFFVLLSTCHREEAVAAAINRHCHLGSGGFANVFKVLIRESTGCYKWVALKLFDHLSLNFHLDCKDKLMEKVAIEAHDVFEYLGFDPYGVGYWRDETPFYIMPYIGKSLAKEVKNDERSAFGLDLYIDKWERHPILLTADFDSKLAWCIDLCFQLNVFHQDDKLHNDLTIANILYSNHEKKWFIIDSNMKNDLNFVKGTDAYNSLHGRDPSEWTKFDDVIRLMALQAVILGCRPEDVYQFRRPPVEDKLEGGLIQGSTGELSFDNLFLDINEKFKDKFNFPVSDVGEPKDFKDLEVSERLLCEIDYDGLVKLFFNRALVNDCSLSISEVKLFFVTIYQLVSPSVVLDLHKIIPVLENLINLACGDSNRSFLNKYSSSLISLKQNNLQRIRTHVNYVGLLKQAIGQSHDDLLGLKGDDNPQSKQALDNAAAVSPDNLNQHGGDDVSFDYSKVALCVLGISCFSFGSFFFLPYMVTFSLLYQAFGSCGLSDKKNRSKPPSLS